MKQSLFSKIKGRVKYLYETQITKGTFRQIILLGIVAIIITIITTKIIYNANFTPDPLNDKNVLKVFWHSLLRMLDPGTIANDSGSWVFLIIMLVITISGLILISFLISILTSGLEQSIENLKKGRSAVYEKDHIVIIGWSSKIYDIIENLIDGNELVKTTKRKLRIVILADLLKTKMEDLIEDHCYNSHKAKIICRSGNPIIWEYLQNLSLNKARIILMLSSDVDDPDSNIIKTLLALMKVLDHNKIGKKKVVVFELKEAKNIKFIKKHYKQNEKEVMLVPIDPDDIVSRLTVQTCLQPGLSKIYEELLNFNANDNEIYFRKARSLGIEPGKKFTEALFDFQNSSLIGIKKISKENNTQDKLIINPLVRHQDVVIDNNDELIFIAKSSKSIRYKPNKRSESKIIILSDQTLALPSTDILIIGWNPKGLAIIDEIKNYVDSESSITILANVDVKGLKERLKNHGEYYKSIKVIKSNTDVINERLLEDKLENMSFQHIIIMAYTRITKSPSDIENMEKCDSKTIQSIFNLRHFLNKKNIDSNIVCEMELAHNRDIAQKSNKNDFIISNAIISALFAQISLKKEISRIYSSIFLSSKGSEIYLKDAKYYLESSNSVNFYDIVEAAKQKFEIAIGYCKFKKGENKGMRIVLNPDKKNRIDLSNNDKIIVLAEEYRFIDIKQ